MTKSLQPNTATFKTLIQGNYLYVDKTCYIYPLVEGIKGIYFLSRPRRFGKSLLVSTLDEIFRGNKELFEGLWIYESDYQWDPYPVIRLDFSLEPVKSAAELKEAICEYVNEIASDYDITIKEGPHHRMFRHLIRQLSRTTPSDQVVILIDEYDKPLIDNLDNLKDAQQIREVMEEFYGIIKAMDPQIRFVLITGVSKFTKVSIFSELNHLTELTMDTAFGSALGLTEAEIRDNFADHLQLVAQKTNISTDEMLAKMRHWYNGFCFAPGAENVYNPFSVLHFFYHQRFSNYWFKTGTPTFLVKLIHQRQYDVEVLDNLVLKEAAFDTYDIKNLALVPLLFQTGYLTIKGYDEETMEYTLSYPNYEVEDAFLTHLLDKFGDVEQGFSASYIWQMIRALRSHDLATFFPIVQVIFANVDYDLHLKYEKYYQTIFYLTFKLIGVYIDAEVKTNDGRIDTVIHLDDHIYLFEFKIDGTVKDALDQIHSKKYYQKYELEGKPITLVGANFNSKTRTVDKWETEEWVKATE